MSLDVIQRDSTVASLLGASSQQTEDLKSVWPLDRGHISPLPSAKPDLLTLDWHKSPASQQEIVTTNFDCLLEDWTKPESDWTLRKVALHIRPNAKTKAFAKDANDRQNIKDLLLAKHRFEDASRPVFRARVTGPVKSALKIFERWRIDDNEAAKILGSDDRSLVLDLRSGSRVLRSRDEKDRVRLLIDIFEGVYALFRNERTERDWIRTRVEPLGSRSLIDLMTEGGFLCLYDAKEYVYLLNGRR